MSFPTQLTAAPIKSRPKSGGEDFRPSLQPSRLTTLMWDQAFLLRHMEGESFADWDRVLEETVDRGYNTVRIDPMPQVIDLSDPDRVLRFTHVDGKPIRYMPWGMRNEIEGPMGRWLIDFIRRTKEHDLKLILSCWWTHDNGLPEGWIQPRDTMHGAELWANQLRYLESEVGLDTVAFVDYANEMPYFFPGFLEAFDAIHPERGAGQWSRTASFSEEQCAFLRDHLDKPLQALQREFPQLMFTHSLHGDLRWLDVGLRSFDCLDIHFYSDADPRWIVRTGFQELMGTMFNDAAGYPDFSRKATETYQGVGPALLARQRAIMSQFASWSQEIGAPLVCTEGWSSWFYYDHPDLDWEWLLDWSAKAVQASGDLGFWGTTTHNYAQPQFANWADRDWHRTINEAFLNS